MTPKPVWLRFLAFDAISVLGFDEIVQEIHLHILPTAGIEPWTSCSTVQHHNHYAMEPKAFWPLLSCGSIFLFGFWPFSASKQPRRSQITSELDSVASITYVTMLSWGLNASTAYLTGH